MGARGVEVKVFGVKHVCTARFLQSRLWKGLAISSKRVVCGRGMKACRIFWGQQIMLTGNAVEWLVDRL